MQSKELNITYFDKNHSSDFLEIRLNEKEKYATNKTDLAKLEHKINLKIAESKITWNSQINNGRQKPTHIAGTFAFLTQRQTQKCKRASNFPTPPT
jgi:hypothetical protein